MYQSPVTGGGPAEVGPSVTGPCVDEGPTGPVGPEVVGPVAPTVVGPVGPAEVGSGAGPAVVIARAEK